MLLSSSGSQTLSFMHQALQTQSRFPFMPLPVFVLVYSSSEVTVFVSFPQLFPSSCPRCCARVARVVKTLSQTLPDSPRFSQTLPDSPRFSGSPRCSQTLPDSPRFCQILLRSPRLSSRSQVRPGSHGLSQTLPDFARLKRASRSCYYRFSALVVLLS